MNNLDMANAVRVAEEDAGEVCVGEIYMATCLPTGLCYIGQTMDVGSRMRRHRSDANHGCNTHFHRAIRKHGWDAFAWRILADDIPYSQLDTQEVFWIRFWNTYLGPGYNMTAGGDANPMDSPESVEKMRRSNLRTQRRKVEEGTHPFVTNNPGPESTQRRIDDGTHHFLTDNPRPMDNLSIAERAEHGRKVSAGWHAGKQKRFREERLAAIEAGQVYFTDD